RHAQKKFRVIVPRYAMSAATILALGAHELVMGLSSQIGPIDPQFPKFDPVRRQWRYIPALTMFDGLKLISEHLAKIPNMERFFDRITNSEQLTLDELGIIERAREVGKQYGFELLRGGMIPDEMKARATVERLTDHYKDHGYPIDAYEAEEVLRLTVCHPTANE